MVAGNGYTRPQSAPAIQRESGPLRWEHLRSRGDRLEAGASDFPRRRAGGPAAITPGHRRSPGAASPGLRAAALRLRSVFGLQSSVFGLWASGFGLRASGRLRASVYGLRSRLACEASRGRLAQVAASAKSPAARRDGGRSDCERRDRRQRVNRRAGCTERVGPTPLGASSLTRQPSRSRGERFSASPSRRTSGHQAGTPALAGHGLTRASGYGLRSVFSLRSSVYGSGLRCEVARGEMRSGCRSGKIAGGAA
jgi:hypothetical protein